MAWQVDELEAHWLGCMAAAGGGGRVTRAPGATVLANPACGGTMLNCMLLRAVTPDRLGETLAMGTALLAAYGRPPALFLSPLAGPDQEGLAVQLGGLGWRRATSQTVLVHTLTGPWRDPNPAVDVAATTDLDQWADLLVAAYEMLPALSGDLRAAWTRFVAGSTRYVIATLDGQPVGTGLTWTQGGIAGLYAGAVLPAWRRRGVERASLLYRLRDARADGARLALLQTESGSPVDHLARQLGFTPAYERTLWLPRSAMAMQ